MGPKKKTTKAAAAAPASTPVAAGAGGTEAAPVAAFTPAEAKKLAKLLKASDRGKRLDAIRVVSENHGYIATGGCLLPLLESVMVKKKTEDVVRAASQVRCWHSNQAVLVRCCVRAVLRSRVAYKSGVFPNSSRCFRWSTRTFCFQASTNILCCLKSTLLPPSRGLRGDSQNSMVAFVCNDRNVNMSLYPPIDDVDAREGYVPMFSVALV